MEEFKLVSFFDGLSQAAQAELDFLVSDYGYRLVDARSEIVRFESPSAVVTATFYPDDHGQVDVIVEPAAPHDLRERLVIGRTVGRASLTRVLQLAADDLRANEPALLGDRAFFRSLTDTPVSRRNLP